ncbi:MAG: hypothetical protein AAGG07_12115 [Planctomycetota bacterium]
MALNDLLNGKNRWIIGSAAGLVAVGAIVGGISLASANAPVNLPETADEALQVMGSTRFERLDDDRKRQYARVAARLVWEMPEEERAALRENEELETALRELRRNFFDDMVYQYARGEETQMPFGRPGGRPGGGGNGEGGENGERRNGEGGRGRGGPRNWSSEMRERMVSRMKDSFANGNAQSSALRGEFFKRRMQSRQSDRPGGRG